jgi:hypothetical protein
MAGRESDLEMRVQLTNVDRYRVHQDHSFGHWRCAELPIDGTIRRLDCTLAYTPGRSQDFAVDVSTDDGAANIRVVVHPAKGHDPQPDNNTGQITIAATG